MWCGAEWCAVMCFGVACMWCDVVRCGVACFVIRYGGKLVGLGTQNGGVFEDDDDGELDQFLDLGVATPPQVKRGTKSFMYEIRGTDFQFHFDRV